MKRLIIALALVLGISSAVAPQAEAQSKWTTYKIMIDPGHGGSDPGASGPSAPHEATLALRCSTELYNQITGTTLGGTCKLTRTTDTYVSLTSRKQMSVSYDPYIFCSIHLNAFNKTAHGTETWYYWTTGNSLNLANKVHAQLIAKLGLTNRGVQKNGWTVITGSASVPAILTEGLFVDNPNEWGLINSNDKQGFKNWVNGHLYGFYDHITKTLGKNVVNPANGTGGGTTPTPTAPTLTASPTGLYFSVTKGATKSMTFTVTGKDLSGNIAVSSSNSAFTVSPTTLSATGGTVTVTFNSSSFGYGDFSGYKINLSNTTNSKTYTASVALSGKVSSAPLTDLTEVWNYSEKRGTKTQRGYDASKIRNFTYKEGKLYCVYNHQTIKVINAQTGEELGDLSCPADVVAGGTLTLCDVKQLDGKIIACNLAVASNNEALRIYCWDNDNAKPYLLKSVSDLRGATRLGDCMELYGSFDGQMNITFANDDGSTTRVIDVFRKDGNWNAYTYKVTTDGTTQFKTAGTTRAYHTATGFWIDGKDSHPTFFPASNNGILTATQKTIDTGETWGSSHHEMTWGDTRYVGNIVFNGKEYDSSGNMVSSKNYKGARLRLGIDPTLDYTRIEQVADYPADGLGETSQNTNCTADAILNTNGSTYVEAWVLSTTHGMAYFRKGTPPTHNVQPITPSSPSIAVSATSVSMSCSTGNTASGYVTVSGSNLEGDIKATISGANASLFTIASGATITKAAAQGRIEIVYAPTDPGTHTATLTLTSTNATTMAVTLSGSANDATQFNDNIESLDQQWVISQTAGNADNYSWLVIDGNQAFTRDIEVMDGKLYVVNAKAWDSAYNVQIVDAYKGTSIGELKIDNVSSGRVAIGGISKIGGQIIAANSAASNHTLRIYKWANDNATPELWFEDSTHGGVTLGDQINTSGDLNNGYIWLSDGKTVYRYTVANGSVNSTPTTITLSTPAGTTNGSVDIIPEADGSFWAVGKDIYPTHYKADGTALGAIASAAFGDGKTPKGGTSGALINFGTRRYFAGITYLDQSNNFQKGAIAFIDITNGGTKVTEAVGFYPADGLGTTTNDQIQSAVTYELTDNNTTLHVWGAVPKQGLAYLKYEGGTGGTGVQPSLIDREAKMRVNAAHGIISVSGADVTTIDVYTMAGAHVASANGDSLNASQLPVGIYIVRATNANGRQVASKIALTR